MKTHATKASKRDKVYSYLANMFIKKKYKTANAIKKNSNSHRKITTKRTTTATGAIKTTKNQQNTIKTLKSTVL